MQEMNKGKVLVIDDERIVLTAFRLELKSAGYDVFTALSGQEALALLAQNPVDIVFTDLIMPGLNGVEVCRRIKSLYPQTEVVLFSGNPLEFEAQHTAFIAAGGRDVYLRKPLVAGQLLSITANLLKAMSYKHDLVNP